MRPTTCLATILIAAITITTSADEILLKDGSKIIGHVKYLDSGKLTITTSFAGEIQVDVTQVTGITTEQPVTTQADTGDRAVGPLEYNPQVGQTVVTDPAGRLNITIDRVTAIWPAGEASPQEKKQAKEIHKLQNPWTAKAGIGINGQSGNSETIAVNGDVSALRDTGNERLKLHIHHHYAKENGEESANEVFGGVGLERDVNDRWFQFGNIDMEFDRHENLDLRAKVTVGTGYFVTREDDDTFKLRAGAGFQHESFDDGSSEDQAIAELGYDLSRKLNSSMLLNHSVTYFPSFDTLDDYRLVGETAIELPLADQDWSLRFGARNTYDGSPSEDTDRLDTYYFLNLVWKWVQAAQ